MLIKFNNKVYKDFELVEKWDGLNELTFLVNYDTEINLINNRCYVDDVPYIIVDSTYQKNYIELQAVADFSFLKGIYIEKQTLNGKVRDLMQKINLNINSDLVISGDFDGGNGFEFFQFIQEKSELGFRRTKDGVELIVPRDVNYIVGRDFKTKARNYTEYLDDFANKIIVTGKDGIKSECQDMSLTSTVFLKYFNDDRFSNQKSLDEYAIYLLTKHNRILKKYELEIVDNDLKIGDVITYIDDILNLKEKHTVIEISHTDTGTTLTLINDQPLLVDIFADYKEEVNKVNDRVNQTNNNLEKTNGNVANNSSNIKKNSNEISVHSQKISNLNGDVAELKITDNAIKATVSNAQHDISQLELTAKSIIASVGNANNEISQLKMTANEIRSSVSNAFGQLSQIRQLVNSIELSVKNVSGKVTFIRVNDGFITMNGDVYIPRLMIRLGEATQDIGRALGDMEYRLHNQIWDLERRVEKLGG